MDTIKKRGKPPMANNAKGYTKLDPTGKAFVEGYIRGRLDEVEKKKDQEDKAS